MRMIDKLKEQDALMYFPGIDQDSLLRQRANPEFDEANIRNFRECRELARKAVPVVVDNVAEYVLMNEKNEWHIERDFPNMAPPWELFWMEYRMPPFQKCLDGRFRKSEERQYGGSLNTAVRDDDNRVFYFQSVYFVWRGGDDDLVCGPLSVRYMRVHLETGEVLVIDSNSDGEPSYGMWRFLYGNLKMKIDSNEVDFSDYIGSLSIPFDLAISFLHCKNTVVKTSEVSEKLQRAYEKRHGQRKTIYKTLNIEPIKNILMKSCSGSDFKIKKALHICRGHFSDYTQGRGLFGKYKGLYWIPQHFRGNRENGVIEKSYLINRPQLNENDISTMNITAKY